MPLNEFQLIKHYFTRQAVQASVVKSVGDDCAILAPHPHRQLVMSMDTMVEGRHFPVDANPYDIGTRALCTSLSDLAAMGARPLWFTLGLTLPDASPEWLAECSRGLFDVATPFECDLIGGDTTKGSLTLSVQVHGEVEPDRCLRRDHACVGDTVFVTGTLGDGAAALSMLQHTETATVFDQASRHYLHQRFYAPIPQIVAGECLAPYAHAAIDISDGLLADAQHIAEASHVLIHIDVEQLPIAPALSSVSYEQQLQWALTGGDDYQLLFTVPEGALASVNSLIDAKIIQATRIGCVCDTTSRGPQASAGVHCFLNGEPYNPGNDKGFQHFAS